MTIGRILKQRRTAYGLTMGQVRERGGPTKAYQSDVENGKRNNVGVLMLIAWCNAIGCEPIMVFGDLVGEIKREVPDKDCGSGI